MEPQKVFLCNARGCFSGFDPNDQVRFCPRCGLTVINACRNCNKPFLFLYEEYCHSCGLLTIGSNDKKVRRKMGDAASKINDTQ